MGAASYETSVSFPGHNDFWFDELECDGTEESLFDCPSNPLGVHDCSSYEHVSVECLEQLQDYNLMKTK